LRDCCSISVRRNIQSTYRSGCDTTLNKFRLWRERLPNVVCRASSCRDQVLFDSYRSFQRRGTAMRHFKNCQNGYYQLSYFRINNFSLFRDDTGNNRAWKSRAKICKAWAQVVFFSSPYRCFKETFKPASLLSFRYMLWIILEETRLRIFLCFRFDSKYNIFKGMLIICQDENNHAEIRIIAMAAMLSNKIAYNIYFSGFRSLSQKHPLRKASTDD